ncbi:MAG: ATP-NAD kinase family protein [Pseudomonadales bacterium]|nr:ATP-NAD kinase family protein [Pseudomonadales bacterium]
MKHENNSCLHPLHIGLLINPIAGLGGELALKGSDNQQWIVSSAQQSRAYQRAYQSLILLQLYKDKLTFSSANGLMGEQLLKDLEFNTQIVYQTNQPTQATDTIAAAQALMQQKIDLLLFVGGDGTARDLCTAKVNCPVLGIPAGVKMHSGVFALNPESAADIIYKLMSGNGVAVEQAEVRDLDELALQQGKIRTQFYGELSVPIDTKLIQQMKCASPDSDALVQQEIAAFVSERLEDEVLYFFGVGSTCAAIIQQLGFEHTLMGFDAILNGELIAQDVNAQQIKELIARYPCKVILTVTGGQGVLLGRGNQQLTPTILRQIGRDNIWVVATPHKLKSLEGRALVLDTGDAALNKAWQGLIKVTTGYEQEQLYYVGQ